MTYLNEEYPEEELKRRVLSYEESLQRERAPTKEQAMKATSSDTLDTTIVVETLAPKCNVLFRLGLEAQNR